MIRQLYNTSTIICNTDIIQVQVRLGERDSRDKNSALLHTFFLGETNAQFLKDTAAKYEAPLADEALAERLGIDGTANTNPKQKKTESR